jgi:hypothetical protein
MLRTILCLMAFALVGCHSNGPFAKEEHRSVNLIAYDGYGGSPIAAFTIKQSAYNYADDSRIYLTVRNLSNDYVSFNFDLTVYGFGGYDYDSFIYSNAVVELAPGATYNFGRISEAPLNIYDSNIYFNSPINVVYQPIGPG